MLPPASSVRNAVARWLETGAFAGVWPDALSRVHGELASRAIARPLAIPPGVAIITVGGATLGGSGKTRVALAVARSLVRRGARIVLVGHAYRASPSRARVVHRDDALADVGDEALLAARSLGDASHTARVVVAPSRQAAVDLAASLSPRADVIIIDGPLQLAPVRASLAILAVDAHAPWGANALPPAGDLRAPRAALLAHADLVVSVDAAARAAIVDGVRRTIASLHGLRLGLFTAIARPQRLEDALRRAGCDLATVIRAPDHGPLGPNLLRRVGAAEVDLWLATEKCALHLRAEPAQGRGLTPIAVLDGACVLPADVHARVAAVHTRGALTP